MGKAWYNNENGYHKRWRRTQGNHEGFLRPPLCLQALSGAGSRILRRRAGRSIPIGKAFELGCDRVVLILTKPEQTLRTPGKDMLFARGIQWKYPVAAESLRQRARRYNDGVAMAQEYARQGRMLIVAPDDTCGIDTLKKDRQAMEQLYEKGYADGKKITDFFRAER